MEPAPRRYLCASCRAPVLICSNCDRGDRYCSNVCAQQMRKSSQQAAAKRYQNSRRGRRAHAARQRLYQERQRRHRWHPAKKVTHQGSPLAPPAALLPPEVTAIEVDAPQQPWQCHFCQGSCAEFVRIDFLRRRIRRLARLADQKEPHHARDP